MSIDDEIEEPGENEEEEPRNASSDALLDEAPEVQVNAPLVEIVRGDELENDRIPFKESDDLGILKLSNDFNI